MNKTVKGTSLVAGGILLGAVGVTAFRFLIKIGNNRIALSKDGLGGSASVSPFGVGEGGTLAGFDGFGDVLPSDVSDVGEYEEDFGENLDSFSSLDSSNWQVKPIKDVVSCWDGNLDLGDVCEDDFE